MDLPERKDKERDSVRFFRPMIIGAGILALLLLAILLLQLRGICRHYQFYIITGGESQCVYGIWKVQEGHPLYAWPNKEFYQLSLYNFAFYYGYANVLNLLHAHGPAIMLYGRFLTVCFAGLGCFIQTRLLLFLTPGIKNRAICIAALLISFCTWFNSYFSGAYCVSIRPDMAAVAVSTLALGFFMRFVMTNQWGWIGAAGIAWAATWCIKQADIAFIFGAGAYLPICRKWKGFALLSATFAVPVGLVLALSSPEYRWNILVAPTANGLEIPHGAVLFLKGATESLFAWTFLITLPLYYYFARRNEPEANRRSLWEQASPGNSFAPVAALAVIVACGFAPSFIALAKRGSSLNQMFEIFVAANILSFTLIPRLTAMLPAPAARRLGVGVCLALLSMCLLPAAQLAMNRIGPITRASDADIARKETFAQFLKSVKKPLFIDDEVYALPWHESDNQYPAIIIDNVFYWDAKKRGMIDGGVEDLIKKHWFSTLYLPTNSPLFSTAQAAQYRAETISPEQTRFLDELNRESPPCVLFSAPLPAQ